MGSTSSSSANSSSGEKGGAWEHQIYFDPEADKTEGSCYTFNDDELREKLKKLVDDSEDIVEAIAYDSPLYIWQLTKNVLNHEFIVLETTSWWWSIEKHSEGITIQRSKTFRAVKDKYRQHDRTTGLRGISENRRGKGRKSVNDLINWLWSSDQLNKKYNLLARNCQDFATAVFDYVT